MRLQWIVLILACMLSMGLLVIIFGQHQVWMMLRKGMEKLEAESETLDKIHAKEEFFMMTMEKLVFQGTKVADDLQSMVTKVKGTMDWKKTENDKCQEEKVKSFSTFLKSYFSLQKQCKHVRYDIMRESVWAVVYSHYANGGGAAAEEVTFEQHMNDKT